MVWDLPIGVEFITEALGDIRSRYVAKDGSVRSWPS